MRFSGLSPGVQSPDAKTIWLFREQLVEAPAKAAQKDVPERGECALDDEAREYQTERCRCAVARTDHGADIWLQEPCRD
jgi:hypothetical protein